MGLLPCGRGGVPRGHRARGRVGTPRSEAGGKGGLSSGGGGNCRVGPRPTPQCPAMTRGGQGQGVPGELRVAAFLGKLNLEFNAADLAVELVDSAGDCVRGGLQPRGWGRGLQPGGPGGGGGRRVRPQRQRQPGRHAYLAHGGGAHARGVAPKEVSALGSRSAVLASAPDHVRAGA